MWTNETFDFNMAVTSKQNVVQATQRCLEILMQISRGAEAKPEHDVQWHKPCLKI